MINDIGEMSFDKLQEAVLKARQKIKEDAPKNRLTKNTFPANFGILDWVSKGSLRKAVDYYNQGGMYDWGTSVSWPREFWLMRIYDAMEELGRANFEKFVPNVWDDALAAYAETFSHQLGVKSSS